MRFMINQSLNGTEIAFNVDAVSSPIEIGTVDAEQGCIAVALFLCAVGIVGHFTRMFHVPHHFIPLRGNPPVQFIEDNVCQQW